VERWAGKHLHSVLGDGPLDPNAVLGLHWLLAPAVEVELREAQGGGGALEGALRLKALIVPVVGRPCQLLTQPSRRLGTRPTGAAGVRGWRGEEGEGRGGRRREEIRAGEGRLAKSSIWSVLLCLPPPWRQAGQVASCAPWSSSCVRERAPGTEATGDTGPLSGARTPRIPAHAP